MYSTSYRAFCVFGAAEMVRRAVYCTSLNAARRSS
jgi:hypothetical protein